jgi:hypothetical protein
LGIESIERDRAVVGVEQLGARIGGVARFRRRRMRRHVRSFVRARDGKERPTREGEQRAEVRAT